MRITVSDDGVRVLLDGEVALENWTHHSPREDRAVIEVSEGKHVLAVQHFELDGFSRLTLHLRKLD